MNVRGLIWNCNEGREDKPFRVYQCDEKHFTRRSAVAFNRSGFNPQPICYNSDEKNAYPLDNSREDWRKLYEEGQKNAPCCNGYRVGRTSEQNRYARSTF